MSFKWTAQSHVGMGSGEHVAPPFYADFLRDNLYPNLYFRQLGTQVTIARGYSDKVKIPRWSTPMSSIAGALTGVASRLGTDVSAIQTVSTDGTIISTFGLSAEDITGTTTQFAGARQYSDKLVLTIMANWVEGALESLGRELAYVLDRHTRAGISASSFDVYATGNRAFLCSTDTPDTYLRGKSISKIAPLMDSRHVPRWEDESFILVTNPLAQFDVYNDLTATGFVPVARYHDPERIYRGEIGNMYGIRMLLSTAIAYRRGVTATHTGNSGFDVDVTAVDAYVFAPDAFYSIEQEDGGVEVIHHPPGSSGSVGDPANQRGSVAIKVHYGVVAAPAADKRLMRFRHAISLTH